MKNPYKLFIFDLDGTLVNTEELYVKSLQKACFKKQFPLDDETAVKLIYGKAWSSTYSDLIKLGCDIFESCEDLQKECSVYFDQLIKIENPAIQPSVELLKNLARNNRVCIVSGSSIKHIAHFIEDLGLSTFVEFFLGNENYLNGKPDPECFLLAAETAAVHASECLVFEDSFAGVTAAKNAGMDCVGFKSSENPQDISHADIVLSCLSHFSPAILAERLKQSKNKGRQYDLQLPS